jgi:hypothetical protein
MTTIAFGRPFDEQLSFFRRKLSLPAERYDSIERSAHDHAFMVAGAMQADLIADLRAAVDKAITQGTGLAQFRKDFDKTVAQNGWEYKGLRNWRTQVIYTTNMRTSYAAGRWAQLRDPDALASRPYWRYQHSDSVLYPREIHVAWDNLILDAKDPWWDTHYPPNGWGCQCKVTAVAKDELATYKKTQPDDPPSDSSDMAGIDPGWDYAPGQSAADTVRLAQTKVSSLLSRDASIAREYAVHLMQDGSFESWYDDLLVRIAQLEGQTSAIKGKDAEQRKINFLVDKIALRLGKTDDNKQKRLHSWPIATLNPDAQDWLGTQASLVNFSTETAIKQIVKHGSSMGVAEYIKAQSLFDQTTLVITDRELHLAFFRQQGKYYKAVIKRSTDDKKKDELYMVSMHQVGLDDIQKSKKKGRVLRDLL